MLVNSIGNLNTKKGIYYSPQKTQNNQSFGTQNSITTSKHQISTFKKAALPLAFVAALFAGAITLTSCKNDPKPSSVDPVVPPIIDPVTQSPVQKAMLDIVKILGLDCSQEISESSSISRSYTAVTGDLKSFEYYDGSTNTDNILTLNTNESSDNELVFDGTSFNQDFETTSYVRYKITESSDKGIIVKQYKTADGNPPTAETTWEPWVNIKYIQDNEANCIEKYSLNSDDTVKELLATISPDTETSLLVTTKDEEIYVINGISITTK